MTIYLSAPPEYAREAALHGLVSIMAYRMGAGFHLYRRAFPKVRPSVMDIDCRGFTGYGPHELLAREIVGECRSQRFVGVSLGIAPQKTAAIMAFCSVLSRECSRYGIALYLPVEYCDCMNSKLLVDTRPWYPTFATRLRTFTEKYGADRLALELDRAYIDFSFPVSGVFAPARLSSPKRGVVISEDDYNAQYGHLKRFLSPHHMSRYVTDIHNRELHIVFGDDSECLRKKLDYAEELGIREAFVYYPQICRDSEFLQHSR